MTPEEWEMIVVTQEKYFNSISKKFDRDEDREKKRDDIIVFYYESFKDINRNDMDEAFKYLREHAETLAFPKIKDIRDAVNEISAFYIVSKAIEEEEKTKCKICGGEGFVWTTTTINEQVYDGMIPCKCETGEKMKRRWRNYMENVHKVKIVFPDPEEAPY